MKELDPLEQTQENLHPVVVAHRVREAQNLRPGPRRRVGTSAMLFPAVVISGVVLVWLLLAAGS